MTTLFMDTTGGDNTKDGSTFANRFKDFTSGATAARTAPGDVIRIMKSPDPTTASVNATWTNGNRTIVLASALTKSIWTCGSAWTGVGANVTTGSATTLRMTGVTARTTVIAGLFGTGQVCYATIASTDFSMHQGISFVVKTDVDVAASTFRIDLCSDTIGTAIVDSFTIDDTISSFTSVISSFTFFKGSALGAAIQSISIVALLDPGTVTLTWQMFTAVNARTSVDCLTVNSLFSKSTAPTGEQMWYKVGAISANGLTITMDTYAAAAADSALVYKGTTETVPLCLRQPNILNNITFGVVMQEAGSLAGGQITYSGGWDTTNMTTQTGETWLTQPFGVGAISLVAFCNVEKLGWVQHRGGFNTAGGTQFHVNLTDCWMICGDSNQPSFIPLKNSTLTRCHASQNNNLGFSAAATTGMVVLDDCHVDQCAGNGINLATGARAINGCTSVGNIGYGFAISAGGIWDDYRLIGAVTHDNSTGAVNGTGLGDIYANNCSFGETTEFGATAGFTSTLRSHNHDTVLSAVKVLSPSYQIVTDAANNHGVVTGYARKFSPLDATYCTTRFPARLKLATFKVAAGTFTFTCWVKRDSQSITARIVCPIQGQVITTAVTAAASAANNTYEQLTLSCTAIVADTVTIFGEAFGGTTLNAWFHDLGRA